MEQGELFHVPVSAPVQQSVQEPKPRDGNPCIALYGTMEGKTCRDCVHCRYNPHQAARHWKCDVRKLSRGKATDHKVSYPACGKYEQRMSEYHGG